MGLTLGDITLSAAGDRRPVPEAFALVVFGASGDLTRRKLLPALFRLDCEGLLPERAWIIGMARTPNPDDGFRREIRESVDLTCPGKAGVMPGLTGLDEEAWRRFAGRLSYCRGGYDDPEAFARLGRRIEELTAAAGVPPNCLFYLATPPSAFVPIVRSLRQAGLGGREARQAGWRRIIVEKPFGHDLPSAAALNAELRAAFHEPQVFRIDHFLGKETVQNLMVLRFANTIFEPIWHQKYVDHVQITVGETGGAEGRTGYYEQAGAIRDIVQNHMMHLLCLVAMEPPASLSAEAIRNEKVKVLQALRPISPSCAASGVVRGQYVAGTIGGQPVPGYRDLPGVRPDSTTETYAAFKVFIDNWRWSGVPFYLRTGKRLAERRTEISIHFRPVPQVLFNRPPTGPLAPNVLAVRIQPNEGIGLEFQVKVPGAAMRIQRLKMDFDYAGSFGRAPPEAYQRLLLDAALGDATLFTRDDEAEAAWRFITPVLEGCASQAAAGRLALYPAGSWGPRQADELIAAEGHRWHIGQGASSP